MSDQEDYGLRSFEEVTSVRLPLRRSDITERDQKIVLLEQQLKNRDEKIAILENDVKVLGWQIDERTGDANRALDQKRAAESKFGYRAHSRIESLIRKLRIT